MAVRAGCLQPVHAWRRPAQTLRRGERLSGTCAGTADAPTVGMRIDRDVNRYILGVLLAFLALNAFAGGIYAITGAEGVPVEWLHGSAFTSYLIPGLALFIVVGGSAALAAVSVFAKRESGFDAAKLAGWLLVVWLLAQLVIVGFVSWLQPATATLAVVILSLAYRPEGLGVASRA